jgi:hypothetical protein
MLTCEGCRQLFTAPGLVSHLKQTQNPRCKTIFEAEYGYVPDVGTIIPDTSYLSDDNDSHTGDGGPVDLAWDEDVDPDVDAPLNNPDPHLESDPDFLFESDPDFPPDLDVDEADINEDSDLEELFEDLDIGWELPVADPGSMDPDASDSEDPDDVQLPPDPSSRSTAHDALRQPPHIQHFNDIYLRARAGTCIGSVPNRNDSYQSRLRDDKNLWAPFSSQIDWEIARWAKLRGPSSTAFSDLLAIEGVGALQSCPIAKPYHLPKVRERLGLSYKTTVELNKIIDDHLPARPPFICKEIVVGGEAFDVYFRDIVACIRSIFGNPEFARTLVFAPERHYLDEAGTQRVYHEMHTGNWWWSRQVSTSGIHECTILISLFCRGSLKQDSPALPSSRSSYQLTRLRSHSFETNLRIRYTLRSATYRKQLADKPPATAISSSVISPRRNSSMSQTNQPGEECSRISTIHASPACSVHSRRLVSMVLP